jgi:MSHA biogenesis protein MshN
VSLINQMLQDLESRKNPQAEAAPRKPVYEDLKPLSRTRSARAPSGRSLMLLAAIAVAGAGAYAWMQWGDKLVAGLSSKQATGKPAPVASRKPASPKPAVAAPAPVPAPVAAPVAAVAQKQDEEPKPATITATQAPVTLAQVKAEAPAAKPAAARSGDTAAGGYWTVSRGETLYSISAKTGIDLWDLSKWNRLGTDHVIHPGRRLRLTPPVAGEKTVVSSAGAPTARKAEPKPTPVPVASVKEASSPNAVMDRRMKPFTSEERAVAEYRRAVDLLQKGRAAEAEKNLKSALDISETYTPARELLAGVMLQQGHWRDAQQVLEQGIEKAPAHYPFAQLLARIYVERGADEKALAVMEQSRGAAAGKPDYLAFMAALYQRVGKHPEAVKTYQEAVALAPEEGRSWLGLGISLEAAQDRDAAKAAYQRAIGSGALDDKLLQYARQRLAIVKNE